MNNSDAAIQALRFLCELTEMYPGLIIDEEIDSCADLVQTFSEEITNKRFSHLYNTLKENFEK